MSGTFCVIRLHISHTKYRDFKDTVNNMSSVFGGTKYERNVLKLVGFTEKIEILFLLLFWTPLIFNY